MMKKILITMIAVLFTAPVAFTSFNDVTQSDNYYDAITWLQDQGVVEGYSDGAFRPYEGINRVEFLKMMYESQGGTDVDVTDFVVFSDVPTSTWYTKYVKAAYDNNVIEGYADGTFGPNNKINRAEAMKIVTRMFFGDEPINFFDGLTEVEQYAIEGCESEGHFLSDVADNSWYEPYFYFAHDKCLIPESMISSNHPPADDLIFPGRPLLRGEMAELLYRAKAIKDNSATNYTSDLIPSDIESLETTQSDVEWLSYGDEDISFTYPKTFLGTSFQEDFDQNFAREEWEVTREDNIIYIRPNFESPAAEFGATYTIELIPTLAEAGLKSDFLEASIEGPESDKGTDLDLNVEGYDVVLYEDVDLGFGVTGNVYFLIPELIDGEQTPPWIWISCNDVYQDYIKSTLIPSIQIFNE